MWFHFINAACIYGGEFGFFPYSLGSDVSHIIFLGAGLNIIVILSVAALAIGAAMALASFVKMFGISFLGKPRSAKSEQAKEVPVPMRVGMGILAALCVLLGILPVEFMKLIDRVSSSISGISILNKFQGSFIFVYYPVKVAKSAIMPIGVLLLIAVSILTVIGVIRLVGGKLKARKYDTWGCGFEELKPRMQYSATGFSKPFRIVFKRLSS